MPDPQPSPMHEALHPSPESPLPSSHCSPVSTVPFPQIGPSSWHDELHPSPDTVPPSSHCSLPSTALSPQIVTVTEVVTTSAFVWFAKNREPATRHKEIPKDIKKRIEYDFTVKKLNLMRGRYAPMVFRRFPRRLGSLI